MTLSKKISLLPEDKIQQLNKYVEKLLQEAKISKPKAKFGSAKGKLWMAEDFDEPLEDFKDYM